MPRISRFVAFTVLLSPAACFHAIITTGAGESSTVVEKPWASSFVFGLVPPNPLDVSSQCKNGVAKVETQHSFLNGLVALLTLEIYTPMDIKVTCAGSGRHADAQSIKVPANASPSERQGAMREAADLARTSGGPVYVKF